MQPSPNLPHLEIKVVQISQNSQFFKDLTWTMLTHASQRLRRVRILPTEPTVQLEY